MDPGTEALIFMGWLSVSLLVGFLVGRWWVALLAGLACVVFIVIVNEVNPCDDSDPGVECDINWTVLAIQYYGPIQAAVVAVGVLIRKGIRANR